MSRLRTSTVEFGSALAEVFVRRSGLIFVILFVLFSVLTNVWVDHVQVVGGQDGVDFLWATATLGLWGLAGLVSGAMIWLGAPALIAAAVVTVWKIAGGS